VPRPRTFDADRVLDAAVRAFWTAGYEATSTESLCEATGLGRSSLYNTFTSKHALYEAALDRYMTERTDALVELLDGPGTVRDRIAALLRTAVDPDPDEPSGCLVVNAMVEVAPVDDGVRTALERDRQRRLAALRTTLAAGRREGSIISARPDADLAEFVNATISGLRVATRAGAGHAVRAAVARTALDAL
jgi:AcrR family transcriptional regulator